MSGFYQEPPVLGNQFTEDRLLGAYLERVLPPDVYNDVTPGLKRLGGRVIGDILEMAEAAESEEPRLERFDAWGNRCDQIKVSKGWRDLARVSAEEGFVAMGYERPYGAWSRVCQFAKLYLFNPSSAIYTCPLAMTDGAARLIEVYGDDLLKEGAFKHLTSRDPNQFWTSGQWMTERTGGSDVGGTETIAHLVDGVYRLYGDKWFTSATTSQMAMTLARIEDGPGNHVPGSKGLSLFYLETYRPDGSLNRIRIHRLKDKLGTRALPTAELTLEGARAQLVGHVGRGVPQIAALFNVTRIYNACSATSFFRRGLALAADYANRRVAFGKALSEHPLHVETLANLHVELAAAFHLTFHVTELLGKTECGEADEGEKAMLRLLTPLVKLYTAKQAIAGISEVLECFGGAGYVENTGLPKMLRDAQVLSIWEGTTNVLSLDVLRAIHRDQALPPFFTSLEKRLRAITHDALEDPTEKAISALDAIGDYVARHSEQDKAFQEGGARGFAFSLARVHAASLMLEQAQWSLEKKGDDRDLILARRWCEKELTPLRLINQQRREASRRLITFS